MKHGQDLLIGSTTASTSFQVKTSQLMTEVKIMRIYVTADSKYSIEMNLNDLTFESNACTGITKIVLDPPDGTSYIWTIQFDILNGKLNIFCNGIEILTKRTSGSSECALSFNIGTTLTISFDTVDTISTHYRPLPGQENLQ